MKENQQWVPDSAEQCLGPAEHTCQGLVQPGPPSTGPAERMEKVKQQGALTRGSSHGDHLTRAITAASGKGKPPKAEKTPHKRVLSTTPASQEWSSLPSVAKAARTLTSSTARTSQECTLLPWVQKKEAKTGGKRGEGNERGRWWLKRKS